MTIGWRSPSSPRYSAPRALVYFVPSLKMLPTSMPLRRITGPPQLGQASPSRTLAMSATMSGVKSRRTLMFRRWNPGRLAPATRFGARRGQGVHDNERVAGADGRAVAGLHAGARISSTWAGRSPPTALTALTSLVSLTSWSPRTMATTKLARRRSRRTWPSRSGSSGTPRNAASAAMVLASGVATSSTGSSVLRRPGRGAVVGATCRLAA